MSNPHQRNLGLDLVRFVAAAMVMVFHLGFWSWATETGTPASIVRGAVAYPEIVSISWWGWVGVEIFFVLSGFVIAFSAQGRSPVTFLRSRVLTLLPAALVCATLTLLVAFAIGWEPLPSLLIRYLKTITFWPLGPWIDGVYWTLAIEISFYSIVLCLLAFDRYNLLERVIVALGLASIVLWSVWILVENIQTSPRIPGVPSRVLQLLLLHHGMYFASGVILWRGFSVGWNLKRLVALAIMMIGGIAPIYSEASEKIVTHGLTGSPWTPVYIWASAVAVMAGSVRLNDTVSASISTRTARWITFVGLATYPLYLIHDLIGAAALRYGADIIGDPYAALLSAIAAMTVLALAITSIVQRHVRPPIASAFDKIVRLNQVAGAQMRAK